MVTDTLAPDPWNVPIARPSNVFTEVSASSAVPDSAAAASSTAAESGTAGLPSANSPPASPAAPIPVLAEQAATDQETRQPRLPGPSNNITLTVSHNNITAAHKLVSTKFGRPGAPPDRTSAPATPTGTPVNDSTTTPQPATTESTTTTEQAHAVGAHRWAAANSEHRTGQVGGTENGALPRFSKRVVPML